MKQLSAGLQQHRGSGATTLAWCWRLTRGDGLRQGFTDHDRDLTFDGTTFAAATGFTASEVTDRVGLNVDNLDVAGALSAETLNEADLAAGRYDGATVEIFRVNWSDVSERVLVRKGSIGEVKRSGLGFTAEVRGLAQALQQPKGRLYQFTCDADLGDQRCGVDVTKSPLKGNGVAVTARSGRRLIASGLDGYAAGWFTRGRLAWTSGANTGRSIEVKSHSVHASGAHIELWQETAEPIAQGDSFVVTAGCNKLFGTCASKFNNAKRFRGFPHLPGNDFIASYPNSGDPGLDGGSLIKGQA